ncbi:sigma-54-dependent transcriptional regulator [Desulfatiglans anilini]|uniref:sigma-54-dependent transcriptional regulator n=1 Tax=Desulfatiglans anilini TaxID=90728 RepID=UPI000480B0BB|nr:sigma-54 dependent transcriptional regulator [Desulfatiglans anilini]
MSDDGKCGRILLVDNEPNSREVLAAILSEENHQVLQARDGEEAIKIIEKNALDVLITDVRMQGLDGQQLFSYVKGRHPDVPVIFLSSFGTVDSAVHAITEGVFYYFLKPPDYLKLRKTVAKAVEVHRLHQMVKESQDRGTQTPELKLIGRSLEIRKVMRIIETIADSECNVLITGETGTGKELVARLLYANSKRSNSDFIAFNCAAIPKDLLEAELFGYEKGAFTGAIAARVGKLEKASGGVLFLDEIGDFDVSLQAKLLRVLEEKEIERLGSNRKRRTDFRLICATNTDLRAKVAKGDFRTDLFYRINVVNINLPPLRKRLDDLEQLARMFLQDFCRREKKQMRFTDAAMKRLLGYSWPGNVRQLRNVVERGVVMAGGDTLDVEHLPPELNDAVLQPGASTEILPLWRLEMEAIQRALHACGGNISQTARSLGISRKALYKRIKEAPVLNVS